MHLLITDSGLGGLSVCAAAERALRTGRAARASGPGLRTPDAADLRITYFNAWPEPSAGYNDLPDVRSRAEVFDRALAAMAALGPDRIVIACNTLSIVYEHTAFHRLPPVPVQGIVGAGVDLFRDGMAAHPAAPIVLVGTRTTIESGAHRERLIAQGIAPSRIAAVACHGLARAIETDPGGETVGDLIEACTRSGAESAPPGEPLYLGVCCTHYTYVRDAMASALARHSHRPVEALDPGDRLVEEIARATGAGEAGGAGRAGTVTVVSKVDMDDRKRRAMAARVEAVSPATAAALLAYTRVPDLF